MGQSTHQTYSNPTVDTILIINHILSCILVSNVVNIPPALVELSVTTCNHNNCDDNSIDPHRHTCTLHVSHTDTDTQTQTQTQTHRHRHTHTLTQTQTESHTHLHIFNEYKIHNNYNTSISVLHTCIVEP